jgi:uncharacterized membrane protein
LDRLVANEVIFTAAVADPAGEGLSGGVVEVGAGEAVPEAEAAEDGVEAFREAVGFLAAAELRAVGRLIMHPKDFISALGEDKISDAISEAEKKTSGEIRVFVTKEAIENPIAAAEKEFIKLGMTATELRNGVLIYVAPKSQTYAIIGDKGVHEKCGAHFWEHITKKMRALFKEGKFTEGIVLAVRESGDALAKHFPWQKGDRNELPNKVVRDEGER